MNDIPGKCVNVVLAVEMGRGLAFVQNPIKIIASFNGRPLESDDVAPEDCPIFNTELVWETEKRDLRKARSANSPIRVEIQFTDKSERTERVGFILLSPRYASVIPFDSKLEIPFKWQKLLGVANDHKSSHPELYLSLTIRDLGTSVQRDEIHLVDIPSEEEEVQESLDIEDVFPIEYLRDGFIQVGKNTDCNETYLLSITIQVAYNLDMLLPEVLVFNQFREKYFISFKLLGITIKSKPFCRDLHANLSMNEKIVIRIRSDYETLRTYLTEHCQIHVSFFCGTDKLGLTQLPVNMLLQNLSEEEFLINECSVGCEHKCLFKFPSEHGIVPTGTDDRQPYIEVATSLKRTEIRPQSGNTFSSGDSAVTTAIPVVQVPSVDIIEEYCTTRISESPMMSPKEDLDTVRMSTPRSGCGDIAEEDETNLGENDYPTVCECGDQNDTPKNLEICRCDDQNEQPNLVQLEMLNFETPTDIKEDKSEESSTKEDDTSRSVDTVVLESLPSLCTMITAEDISKNISMYQQYCLDVILENITLKKHLNAKKLCFKFKHPKAATMTDVTSELNNNDNYFGEAIFLENTRCKMFFISNSEHIRKMVYAWPPKLVLTDENDQVLTEELDIYTAMFLAKSRTECSYVTEWKAVRTYEPLAKISISMYLQEYGLSALPQPTESDLLPPILDEEIAIKELIEIQEWKTQQKAEFFADLKIMEKQQMSKVNKDWAKKKKALEKKLNKSVDRCRDLSEELQTAVNNIRTKRAMELKESLLNNEPNCSFDDILQKNIMKYSTSDKKELVVTISKMERDNSHLNGIINDLRTEILQIKKTALTKEQTTSLLQQLRGLEEKFEEAQKAKGYFKDQWKKAVREIHDIKSEEQKVIQEKIQNQMNELSQFSLDSFVHSDGGNSKYESSQNRFLVPVHTPHHFDEINWNNFDCSLLMPNSMPLVSYSNPNI